MPLLLRSIWYETILENIMVSFSGDSFSVIGGNLNTTGGYPTTASMMILV
jgi:hypothetical protein